LETGSVAVDLMGSAVTRLARYASYRLQVS
jgi:hypothetical protein